MTKPLISVIIPCYKVEDYIEKCVDSILNQTYKKLEIILVDDGSPDNCPKICDEYAKKDERVIVIHKENGGLSDARNAGLDIAKGEYISFIDSDDYVDLNFYESLINSIIKEKTDVAICDIKMIYEEDKQEILCPAFDGEFNLLNLIDNGLVASSCNKLFKSDLIKQYLFAKGKVNEDLAVVIPTLINSGKISHSNECFYYYVQRKESIQNSTFSKKRFDIIDAVDLTLQRIKKTNEYEMFKDVIIFNQIIALLLFVIPKIDSFFYRYSILREFSKRTKKYNILKNNKLKCYINNQNLKNKIYFRCLCRLESMHLYLLANLLISFYKLYSNARRKKVVKLDSNMDDLIELAKKQKNMKNERISVSVVVPNYNYEKFLYQRLYSILNQNYKLKEIIILDDCSTDESVILIDKIVEKISKYVDIKKEYNKVNSGTTFRQWEKGFEMATGDYVWIAEADDYCEPSLIRNLIKPIKKDSDIRISYSDTAFIGSDGRIKIRTVRNMIDLMETGHWNKSYINNGHNEFDKYTFLNCTIANVSSCIIKNDDYKEFLDISKKYKQAGDWIFYANVMNEGKISYVNKTLNYYREHGSNVSSTFKKQKHLDEIKSIHNFYDKKYGLNKFQKDQIKKRYDFLQKAWNIE